MPVEMPIAVRSATVSFLGRSQNIGLGGLFVAVDGPVSIGDRFTLEFQLPDHIGPMSVGCEVRWICRLGERPSGAGMRFVNPSIGATVALLDLVRRTDQEGAPALKPA